MANPIKVVKGVTKAAIRAKTETTGTRKGMKIAFNNGDKISQQGNKQKISGSLRDLKKSIKKAK
jgi:hypothetical protein